MKFHWFSMLGIVGIILLSENSFGAELQWKKPMDSKVVVPPVAHIPTVITTDDDVDLPAISQVQHTGAVQPPDTRPQAQNPLPGATVQNPLPDTTIWNVPQGTSPPPGAAVRSGQPISPVLRNEPPLVPCTDIGRSIKEISYDIRPTSTDELPAECIIEGNPYSGRHFGRSCYMWTAPALSTKAAYFEDVQLERHGHSLVCKPLQPIVSGAKFFATIPLLPYKMGVTPPNECVYTLGHYRADSCAPYMVEPCPISLRGALFQAGAVTGAIFAIP